MGRRGPKPMSAEMQALRGETRPSRLAKVGGPSKRGPQPKTLARPVVREPGEYVRVANEYATDVLEGRVIAGKLTWKACQRHVDDQRRADFPYQLDTDAAERACSLIERLPHVKGQWAKDRKLIELEAWQVFLLVSIFGWVHVDTGLRRFKRAYVEVARKNSKSTLAAGVGIYMGAADGEEQAEVYCGATTKDQALEVFRTIKQMVDKGGQVREELGLKTFAAAVAQEATMSRIVPVIGKPGDGASPSCALVDEYHEHLTTEQYDTMLTGMGARSQPLLLVITTAGVDIAGPCYQLRDECVKVLDAVTQDEELFALIYEPDDGDDWTQEATLWKANPNAGVSVSLEFLRARQREAIQNSTRAGIFKTKHLDLWVAARSPYFNVEYWKKQERRFTLDDLAGSDCMVFLDLASKKDLAAMAILTEKPHRVVTRFWLPEDRVNEVKTAPYRAWVDSGHLVATPGSLIDFGFIEEEIRRLSKVVSVREIAYDPQQATQLATRMLAENFPMVEFPQTVPKLSEPMKALDALILGGEIEHDGNPVMTWCLSNVVAKVDAKENVFPRKEREESKIDGAVALIGALARWIHAEPPAPDSVYEGDYVVGL
jgi:phage terminase large subunit-like protein